MSRIKTNTNQETSQNVEDLMKVLADLDQPEKISRFFEDLCTPSELRSMADRWKVVRLLEQKIPYRKINQLTGVSTATITRVARSLDYGEGYRLGLDLIKEPASIQPVITPLVNKENIDAQYQ